MNPDFIHRKIWVHTKSLICENLKKKKVEIKILSLIMSDELCVFMMFF